MLVDNIMIEPKGASERFILYGTRVDSQEGPNQGSRVGVVIALDFSQLHQKQCAVRPPEAVSSCSLVLSVRCNASSCDVLECAG